MKQATDGRLAEVTATLLRAGCVAADEEAIELVDRARDVADLESMVARRVRGEPLAWITGSVMFCGLTVIVTPGVFVPRWQSEPLCRLAIELVPDDGVAVDLCTGTGAIAMALHHAHTGAEIIATEIDPVAIRCAKLNGVTAAAGDLDSPIPHVLAGCVDVMVGVVPYVPSEHLHNLPRDVLAFEPRLALDGGLGGLQAITRVISRAPKWIRQGGWLLVEIGAEQLGAVRSLLERASFAEIGPVIDQDGDVRGVRARRS